MVAEALIDRATFDSLKESLGAEFMAELIATFNEETPRLLIALLQAESDQNLEEFTRMAHSIKSSSNSLGALPLGNLAKELEMMGRAGDIRDTGEKIGKLAEAFAEVKQALEDSAHAQ